MKPLFIPPSVWPGSTPILTQSTTKNQQMPSAIAPPKSSSIPTRLSSAARFIKHPFKTWLPGLPDNVFGQIITAAISQGPVVKCWLSEPALFLPGLVLLTSLVIVVLSSLVLWPYGIFQQTAEGLWLYLNGLQARYISSKKVAEKSAIAFTMGVIGIVDLVLTIIASPIFLGRLYMKWIALAPVKHTAISAAVVAGGALFLALIIPIIVFVVISGVIAAIND